MNLERLANFIRATVAAGTALGFTTACETPPDPNIMQLVDYEGQYVTSTGRRFDATTTRLLFKTIDPYEKMRCEKVSSNLDYLLKEGIGSQPLSTGKVESCTVKAVRPYRPSQGRR